MRAWQCSQREDTGGRLFQAGRWIAPKDRPRHALHGATSETPGDYGPHVAVVLTVNVGGDAFVLQVMQ